MVPAAIALQGASIFVLTNEVASLPLLTDLKRVILEEVRLPPEVLPVVRVDTLRLIVLSVVRAPLSLEVKHKELLVAGHLVDQRSLDVLIRVRKTTE